MVTPVWQLCGSHHLYDSALCSNFSSRGEKVQSFDCCSVATAEDEAISDPLREGCQTLLNAWLLLQRMLALSSTTLANGSSSLAGAVRFHSVPWNWHGSLGIVGAAGGGAAELTQNGSMNKSVRHLHPWWRAGS